jgi:hypothetical protein
MRFLLVLVLLMLAGCATPKEDAKDPLLGWCPQWEQAGSVHLSASLENATGHDDVAPNNLSYRGHPFDLVRLDIKVEGDLVLRATDVEANRSAALRDHRLPVREQIQPQVRFDGGGKALVEVFLNPIDADLPRSGPIRLEWTGTGSYEADAAFLYRVCGA